MATDDGTYQEMSVFDKEHAQLGPTHEEQDVSRLDRIVVPPPAYQDPSNPAAASGSINMSVTTHPSEIAEDYGADVLPGEDDHRSAIDTHAVEMAQVHTGGQDDPDLPEDREEWKKADWQQRAKQLGLTVSGNMETIQSRVEGRESEIEDAKAMSVADWKDLIDGADNGDDLAEVRGLYDASGAEYSSVVEDFDKRSAELTGNNE
jgi:hypothetical protein